MANLTVRLQNRTVSDINEDTTEFQLRAEILARTGDISPAVFVIKIDTFSGEDSFERVATLTDLGQIVPGKTVAQTKGDDFYRVSNFDIVYDTYDQAVAGRTAVRDAVNELVREYNAFSGVLDPQMNIIEETVNGVDLTFLENLKSDYFDAVETVSEREAEAAALQTTIDNLKELLDTQRDRVENLAAQKDVLRENLRSSFQADSDNYTEILTFPGLTGGETTQVQGYQTAKELELTNIDNLLEPINTLLSDERALQETYFQDLQDAVNDQTQKESERAVSQSEADRLISAIIELDPTFDGTA